MAVADLKNVDQRYPDRKVHGGNMGTIWSRQDPGGPHFGPINLAIWVPSIYIMFLTNVSYYEHQVMLPAEYGRQIIMRQEILVLTQIVWLISTDLHWRSLMVMAFSY